MRRPVDRKIGVLAIKQNFARTTEHASSQEVVLKVVLLRVEIFYLKLKVFIERLI
jgi:hypothetical protein